MAPANARMASVPSPTSSSAVISATAARGSQNFHETIGLLLRRVRAGAGAPHADILPAFDVGRGRRCEQSHNLLTHTRNSDGQR